MIDNLKGGGGVFFCFIFCVKKVEWSSTALVLFFNSCYHFRKKKEKEFNDNYDF